MLWLVYKIFYVVIFLLSREQYPKNGYLKQLKRQLLDLGIPDPSETEVANLAYHDSNSVQRGAGLPLTTAAINPRGDLINMPGTWSDMRSHFHLSHYCIFTVLPLLVNRIYFTMLCGRDSTKGMDH